MYSVRKEIAGVGGRFEEPLPCRLAPVLRRLGEHRTVPDVAEVLEKARA
ncbi:hypothetical protein GZL_06184 [Streptomyces sp. 769]|nr:hypothetical protein GZL_06184 [Streptomyces sp. 769]